MIPRIESKGVRWRLSMEHFYVQDQQAAAEESAAAEENSEEDSDGTEE